ncbi:MAG: potassium channel family protein [Candidatus Hermodarchaeota archaeon]
MTKTLEKARIRIYKEQIFNSLNYPESKTVSARYLAFFLIFASLVSGLITILETDENFILSYSFIFIIIEIILAVIFSIEYIFRLWTSEINPKYQDFKLKNLGYVINFKGIIDLASSILFILSLLISSEYEWMDGIRLLRIIALLKLIRYSESFEIIFGVIRRKKEELLITLILSLLLMFFGALLMFIAEHEAQPDKFTNLFSSMWFTAINLFTIGYGEIVPKTVLGKVISAVVSVLGITLFLLPAAVIGSGYIDELKERNPQYEVCPNCNTTVQKEALFRDLYKKRRGRLPKIIKQALEAEKAKKLPQLTPEQQNKSKYYNLLQFPFPRSLGQVMIFFFFITFITLNVLAIMVETNPTLSEELRSVLNTVYIISIIVFTCEYVLRFWSCEGSEQEEFQDSIYGKQNYVKSPLAIVDLITIIALFMMLIPGQLIPTTRQFFLILLMCVVFKVGHFIDVFSISGLIFKDTKREFLSTIFICILFLIFSSTVIYFYEHSAQPEKFPNISATLWFGIVTFTTTGFGDVYPVTTAGRFLTICFAFIGVALFTLPAGILGSSFFSSMQEYRLHRICPKCGFVLSKPKIINNKR